MTNYLTATEIIRREAEFGKDLMQKHAVLTQEFESILEWPVKEILNHLLLKGILMPITYSPIEDRVVLLEDEVVTQKGSIIIPDISKDKPQTGTVLAVGPGLFLEWQDVVDKNSGNAFEEVPSYSPMPCDVGDRVVFSKYSGAEVELDGQKVIIMRASDLLAVIE